MKYRTYDDDTLDMFDHIYESIKDPSTPEYKRYTEIVKTYKYHPDDDFEKIINIMIDEIEMEFF
jgi:hypothetical protein